MNSEGSSGPAGYAEWKADETVPQPDDTSGVVDQSAEIPAEQAKVNSTPPSQQETVPAVDEAELFIKTAPKEQISYHAYVLGVTLPSDSFLSQDRANLLGEIKQANKMDALKLCVTNSFTALPQEMQERRAHIAFMRSTVLSIDDLKDLCFHRGLDYDNLSDHENLGLKIIDYLQTVDISTEAEYQKWQKTHQIVDIQPEPECPITFTQGDRLVVHQTLMEKFSMRELRGLLTKLDMNYEYIEGQTPSEKISSIVQNFSDTQLHDLIYHTAEERPRSPEIQELKKKYNITEPLIQNGMQPFSENTSTASTTEQSDQSEQTPSDTPPLELEHREIIKLRDMMMDAFSLEDFKVSLRNVDVDPENIPYSDALNDITGGFLQKYKNTETLPKFLQAYVNENPPTTDLSLWCQEKGIVPQVNERTTKNSGEDTAEEIAAHAGFLELIQKHEELQEWACDNGLSLDSEYIKMSPQAIWQNFEERWQAEPDSYKKKFLSYNELRAIVDKSNLDLQTIKIWYTLVLKKWAQLAGDDYENESYDKHVDTSTNFLKDTILRDMLSYAKRRAMEPSLLRETFNEAVHTMQTLKNGSESEHVATEVLICASCGTKQRVSVLDASVPTGHSCIACNGSQLVKEIAAIQKEQPDFANIQGIANFIAVSPDRITRKQGLEEIIKLYKYDRKALRRWASRVVLHASLQNIHQKHAKLPFEDITLRNMTDNAFVLEVILYSERRSITTETLIKLLQPKPGNKEKEPALDESNARTCYCADCGDVWLQNIDDVTLTQVTDEPLYDTQGHEIHQVACDNPDCGSDKVYYNADFSPSYAADIEQLVDSGNIGLVKYLRAHFSSEEIKRLIAEIAGDDSIYEDLSFTSMPRAAQELQDHYRRRNLTISLAARIVKYQFESHLDGHSIAVQCQYCGRVATTRMNSEGMILIDNCSSCANINKWQVYRAPFKNEAELTDKKGEKYVPYDMYGNYLSKVGEVGELPTMLHQTVLQ